MRLFLAACMLAACTRTKDAPAPAIPLDASPTIAATAGEAGIAELDDEAYRSRDPIGGKSIGHTSVVFKVKLEGGLDAAFKPRSRRGNGRYRGEVAAYRLARALDLDNVPRAMVRPFD